MGTLGNNFLPFNPLATSGKPRDAQRFNGDNTTTTFNLNFRVDNPTDLEVFVENVQQEPLTAYDAIGSQLIFTEAPPSGTNNIYVVYRNVEPGVFASIPDGSITFNKLANNIRLFTTDNFTGDGGTTTFTLSSDVPDANTLVVAVDGVLQRAPIQYTATANTITFSSAPSVSSNVHVRHLGLRTTQTITALPANTTISQPTLESPTVTGTMSANIVDTNVLSEGGSGVVVQSDIGTAPNQVPLNQFLGSAAFANQESFYSTSNNITFRNKFINGDMRIAQRGTTSNPTGSGYYTVDRWRFDQSSGATAATQPQFNQSTDAPPGFTNSIEFITGTGGTPLENHLIRIRQVIEGTLCQDLAWGTGSAKPVTLSFWVKSSLTGTHTGNLQDSTNTLFYVYTYTVNTANTWEYKTVTIPGPVVGTWPTGTTRSIYLSFVLVAGSTRLGQPNTWSPTAVYGVVGQAQHGEITGASWYVTGVQLEAGTVATPFEHRPIGVEENLCYRYFFSSGNIGILLASTRTDRMAANDSFPVTMRDIPTLTFVESNATANSLVITRTKFRYRMDGVGISTTTRQLTSYTADSEI